MNSIEIKILFNLLTNKQMKGKKFISNLKHFLLTDNDKKIIRSLLKNKY